MLLVAGQGKSLFVLIDLMMLILRKQCWQAHQHKPGLQMLDNGRAPIPWSALPQTCSTGQDSWQLCV